MQRVFGILGISHDKNLGTPVVMAREKAPMGLFITLAKPTAPMEKEAASAGVLDTPFEKFARLQIVTIEDLFAGKKPAMPVFKQGFVWISCCYTANTARARTSSRQNIVIARIRSNVVSGYVPARCQSNSDSIFVS